MNKVSSIEQMIVMFEHSHVFMYMVIDQKGHYRYINEKMSSVTGWERSLIAGRKYDEQIHYADVEFFRQQFQHAWEKKEAKLSVTARYLIDEHQHTIQWEISCTEDQQGEPVIQAMGVLLSGDPLDDFSATRYAYQFNEYLDGVSDGFFALDRNWTFLKVNRFFESVTGLSRQEMIGRSFGTFFRTQMINPMPQRCAKLLILKRRSHLNSPGHQIIILLFQLLHLKKVSFVTSLISLYRKNNSWNCWPMRSN